MKHLLTTVALAAVIGTPCLLANDVRTQAPLVVLSSAEEQASVSQLVAKQVTAEPARAGEFVKAAILDHKADAALIAQIIHAAVTAAPDQADSIRKCAVAVAPDAQDEINALVAAVLKGDQVAPSNGIWHFYMWSDGRFEPEGRTPNANQVWLFSIWAYRYWNRGYDINSLRSFTSNTFWSPNGNHNNTGVIIGGGTVVVRPTTTTSP